MELYKDQQYLKYQLKVLGKTRKELAKELGVCKAVIDTHYNPKLMEKNRIRTNNLMRKQKQEAIKLLGGKCVICGEDNIKVLSLDHKNNNGAVDRKSKKTTRMIYRDIINKRVDINDYQCLCLNCNCGTKRRTYMRKNIYEMIRCERYH